MTPSPDKFAELLTEAVYRIRLRESKSLQVVQDELGHAIGREGGSVITYWRRGNTPSKLTDLEGLTHELMRRGGLAHDWAQQFMAAGGFPESSLLTNQSVTSNILPSPLTVTQALPRNMYRRLVGREALVAELVDVLFDPDGRWCVAIDGLGGIGKTAVALEVVQHCLEHSPFVHIIWLSAAVQREKSDTLQTSFSFEDVLNGIALQLNLPEIVKLPRLEKEKRLQAVMQYSPILVVLDNLETASESQETIVAQLRPFLNPSKVLLTCRERFTGEVYALHLGGLSESTAIGFMRQDALEKGIVHLQEAKTEQLASVATVTGGSPLALKLVVSQIAYLPLDLVLQHLKQATSLPHVIGGGEYVSFYKYVFSRSWSLLDDPGKCLLVAMARFVPSNGSSFAALHHTSDLPHVDLISSIDYLWRLSLLEIGEIESLHQIRYYLHPLTQYFVLSDIARVSIRW